MSKIILPRSTAGILPPYLLLELGQRTGNPRYFETLAATARLRNRAIAHGTGLILPFADGTSKIEVYDCNGTEDDPGTKARFEGEPASSIADVNNAYQFSIDVRNYYRDIHGRNGIDGHGMTNISSVRYSVGYNNAFWNGRKMTYGTGDQEIFASFVIRDVCGHEETHGVTEYEAQLVYEDEPGAENEHHSDAHGKMVEAYAKNQPVEAIDWVLGRGIFMPGIKGDGIRNMLKPGTAYNDPKLGKDPQPDRYSKYSHTSGDNGGVHYNSGILNRAYALFCISLGGYEWKTASKIWFAARRAAGSTPSFANLAFQTLEACKTIGKPGYEKKLNEAWEEVEVKPSNKVSGPAN